MDKISVLLLLSKNIDLEILNDSPRFFSYHFFAATSIQYLESTSSEKPNQKLLRNLRRKIRLIAPKYLIVHFGIAFERYPMAFLDTVLDVNELYPELKIGMDGSREYVMQHLRDFKGEDSEKTKLLGRLARKQSIFDMDTETAYLTSCLH